jgi:molybdopterin-guanine dinucleotide biosynthesis protein A
MGKPNGLVMTGGLSSRMGRDKALIEYTKGIPQYIKAAELIAPFCDSVFISVRDESTLKGNLLYDLNEYKSIGPLAGVLTALKTIDSPWMVIGTDYPLLEAADMEKLARERNPELMATVYMNAEGYIEPFIGIYENAILPVLAAEAESGITSLQTILRKNPCKYIYAEKAEHLKSFDTPEDYFSYQQIQT